MSRSLAWLPGRWSPAAWLGAVRALSPARRFGFALGLVVLVAALSLRHSFLIVTPWNVMSESLPQHWFFVRLAPPGALARGAHVAFAWHGPGLPEGAVLIKRVAGLPGDTVTREPAPAGTRRYYVNDSFVGIAKAHARSGEALAPGPTGVIDAGHYYVLGTHPDSLDSRYARMGWIAQAQLLGRAYPLTSGR